jgi:thiol-disulfide isomerase/thioredoxin
MVAARRVGRGLVCGAVLAWAGVCTTALGGDVKSFPDAWFYEGASRPAELKKLEGHPAPDMAIDKWIGDSLALKDQKGKVVVLDFWATWCGPCMAAIPKNVELVKKYKDKGMVFIGVHDAKSGWEDAQKTVTDKSINYPVGLDKSGSDGNGTSTKNFKLQFWPTYIVIDRQGVVRGAGLMPDHVEEAVKTLLAEAGGAPADAPSGSGLPADWYFGGAARPAMLKGIEGKPAARIAGKEWIGKAVQEAAWKDHVVVVHFFSPANSTSMKQFDELAGVYKEFASQGVVFLGVCDSKADWTALEATAKERKIEIPLVRDVEEAPTTGKDRALDAARSAYGVKYAPVTVVIDRAGVVRAAGIRTERVKELVGKLMAERLAEHVPVATPDEKPAQNPAAPK